MTIFKKTISSKLLIALCSVVIVVLGLYYFADKPNKGNGQIPSVDDASKSVSSLKAVSDNRNSSQPSNSTKLSPPISAADLATPEGTFVSNHRPSLGGSSAQKSEQSTCSTNPGASCRIVITNGTVTKTLQEQTIDSSGTTFWSWNIDDAGLTIGSWKVSATASLDGQTKTSADPIDLVVSK